MNVGGQRPIVFPHQLLAAAIRSKEPAGDIEHERDGGSILDYIPRETERKRSRQTDRRRTVCCSSSSSGGPQTKREEQAKRSIN